MDEYAVTTVHTCNIVRDLSKPGRAHFNVAPWNLYMPRLVLGLRTKTIPVLEGEDLAKMRQATGQEVSDPKQGVCLLACFIACMLACWVGCLLF